MFTPCHLAVGLLALAADADYVPKPGEFPPADGIHLAGELVAADPINRRGGLRLDGDFDEGRYHAAPTHDFSLLPYAVVRYHGAPAELRDIPIGTHLHGSFFRAAPPDGKPYKGGNKYASPYTRAVRLEDDFSFYQRLGRAWKVTAVDRKGGRLNVTPTGPATADGLSGDQSFWVDDATRVWTGRTAGDWADLAPGQVVQVNLGWCPEWPNAQFRAAEVWADDAARQAAAERQRRAHTHYQKHHWLAGRVDRVDHRPGGGGAVTVTVFGGMDPALYADLKAQARRDWVYLAAAEPTLRTWWQDHDKKGGPAADLADAPDAPPGTTGLRLTVQVGEVLDGFRPGRIVRVRPTGWPNAKMPPEFRIQSLGDR